MSKKKIKESLKKRYAIAIKRNIENALKKMKIEIKKLRKEAFDDESNMQSYMELSDKLFKCQKDIQNIDNNMFNPLD